MIKQLTEEDEGALEHAVVDISKALAAQRDNEFYYLIINDDAAKIYEPSGEEYCTITAVIRLGLGSIKTIEERAQKEVDRLNMELAGKFQAISI